jgi:hypothetical protein
MVQQKNPITLQKRTSAFQKKRLIKTKFGKKSRVTVDCTLALGEKSKFIWREDLKETSNGCDFLRG